MFTDCYGYETKAQLWTKVLVVMDKSLPSYRNAKLSLGNLEREIKKFERDCPPELILTVPEKLRKRRGQYKRRVSQLDKIVDRYLRKLIEEAAIQNQPPRADGKRFKASEVRGIVQKIIANINRKTNMQARKALRDSYGALGALGGEK